MDSKSGQAPPRVGELLRNIPPVCYVCLMALLVATLGVYLTAVKFWRVQMESNEKDLVNLLSKRIGADLEPAVADLLILAENSPLVDFLEKPDALRQAKVEKVFMKWGRLKPDYFIIRYIDFTGRQVVVMDSSQGAPRLRQPDELPSLSRRYFFVKSVGLSRGEVYISGFDLNGDGRGIERPPHPTIRFCAAVFDRSGVKHGVLVFNYEGRRLLEHLSVESGATAGQIALLNSEGYWLKGPRPEDEWGFMAEKTKDRSFRHDFPEDWARISGSQAGSFYSPNGFFAFRTVSPLSAGDRIVYHQANLAEPLSPSVSSYVWKIVSVVPSSVLSAKSHGIWMWLLELDALGLVILLWVSGNMARWRVNRERAALSLKRQAELLDLAQDAIVVRDLNHTILHWNSGAERLYGWTRKEAIGLNYLTILRPVSAISWSSVMQSLLGTGQWSGEASAFHKDGRKIDTLNRLALQRDDHGAPAAILSIATDISERKKNEAELQSAKHAAESASLAKSEFLAVMSHEIRTPMNGVIGMTGLLLDTPLSNEQREYAETVRHSADALLTIINDILDFSKMEAGKMSIETIPCDLRIAVEEVAELMAAKAREKGLDLILRYSPDAPRRLIADPGRVRQILINLAGNAIKFTMQGHVYLSVECEEQNGEQARLKFSVEDTGIGIPEEKLDTIFERFTQADASTTRKFGGTGLGLAISKQLAELMGGTMGVESRAGEGSKFWMRLPLALDLSPEEVAPPKTDLSGLRVLGVDDNPTNLFVLREQLNSWGLRNDMTSSGEAALRLMGEARKAGDPFQIAILDQQMPEMDGEALCRAIKENASLRDTVVVLLTSMGMRGDAARMKEAGFAAYLTKPTRQSQLHDALETVWSAQSSARSGELVTRHTLAETYTAQPAAKPPDAALPQELSTAGAARRRILVVEDNAVNQKVATRLLEKLGFRVDVAANGAEAVEMVGLLPYDLVLMDCQMPVMDGFEATRQIRRSEGPGVHRPVIAMTANAMQGDREQCLAAGMDDYLSKPIRSPDLVAMLERQLRQSAAGGVPATSEKSMG